MNSSLLAKSMQRNQIFFLGRRFFGAKGKPAGGPGASAPYVPPPPILTNFEKMIQDNGEDQFLFGPPHGVTKQHNAHRNYIAPKIGTRMEFLAKKMREQYVREALYPDVKIFLDPLRERQPDDSL